jgi:hypothetical protein
VRGPFCRLSGSLFLSRSLSAYPAASSVVLSVRPIRQPLPLPSPCPPFGSLFARGPLNHSPHLLRFMRRRFRIVRRTRGRVSFNPWPEGKLCLFQTGRLVGYNTRLASIEARLPGAKYFSADAGGVAERFKALVLKTSEGVTLP